MVTLQEVYDQVVAIKNGIDQVNSNLQVTNTTLSSGFQTLNQDLAYTNYAINHISLQEDTIICILEKISRNTCALLNQETEQTRLQGLMEHNLAAIREMYKLSNPAAAVQLECCDDLRKKIEACCPPPKPEPVCTYQPCPAPRPLDPLLPPDGKSGGR